jgi:hypothetical protein
MGLRLSQICNNHLKGLHLSRLNLYSIHSLFVVATLCKFELSRDNIKRTEGVVYKLLT